MRKRVLWACANSKPPDQPEKPHRLIRALSIYHYPMILSADRDYADSFDGNI